MGKYFYGFVFLCGMIFLILSVLVSTIAKEVTTISFKDIDAFAVKMQNTANEFAQNLNKALASINVQSVELNDVLESAGDHPPCRSDKPG